MKLAEFTSLFEEIVMVEAGTINLDTQLNTLDDWDSLSRASLLTTIEESFEVKVEETQLRKAESFADVVNLISDFLEK